MAYRTVYILSYLSENSPFAVCKVSPFIHFYMDGLVLRIGIWQVHFIVFFMWWIRDFQEGEFIPCNTAQLIAKCPPNAFCFLVKESKNKNILLVLKNFWWLLKAIVAFKKATGTCLIGEKLQPKTHSNLF